VVCFFWAKNGESHEIDSRLLRTFGFYFSLGALFAKSLRAASDKSEIAKKARKVEGGEIHNHLVL
jgi:hypothetical protein